MKKRLIASIALGGAALLAVPAGVAYAVASPGDGNTRPSIGSGGHDAQRRGPMTTRPTAPRAENAGGIKGNHTSRPAGDPAAIVEPDSVLTADEAASLTYMVEEEKLAHDLYVELGDAWDLSVFVNISDAESTHADAIRSLLDAYSIEDPTAGMAAGEFANAELQDMYDTLLAKGLTSMTEALEVGGLVEETDIADLRERQSDNVAIDRVFDQLEAGSEKHLRAFVRNLDRQGVSYDAQVLSSSDVADIVNQ